jgi:hypothetical protein
MKCNQSTSCTWDTVRRRIIDTKDAATSRMLPSLSFPGWGEILDHTMNQKEHVLKIKVFRDMMS